MASSTGVLGPIRRHALKVSIGCLAISALVAIVAVLAGDFGDFEVRVLISTFTIAVTSICALIASAFGQRPPREAGAMLGLILSTLAALLILVGIWVEIDAQGYWKTAAVLGIFAIGTAHAMALVLVGLRPAQAWMQRTAVVVIAALALLLALMLVAELDGDGVFRTLAVLSILVALATVVIPVTGRLQRPEPTPTSTPAAEPRELHLRREAEGSWRDAEGRRYTLRAVDER